jgi:hypothetical protein
VAECQRAITSAEFSEWQAYFRIRPFGPWLQEYLAAQIQATDVNKRKQKNETPVQIRDFMPQWIPEPEPTQEEIWQSVERVFSSCQSK